MIRSLTAASAVVLGSLALGVSASSAAPAQSAFQTRAGALCQSYFSAVKTDDAAIKTRLGHAPSNGLQILVTAELLYTNSSLSLATQAQLAKLAPPPAEAKEWATVLDVDLVAGQVTQETSEVLSQLLLSVNASNDAVSSYDAVYGDLESVWDAGIKKLGITGCE